MHPAPDTATGCIADLASLRRRPRSVALLRLGYRAAYRALQAWTFVRRPGARGTMIAVRDDAGRILLVRHTYGDRRRWELPGGWVQRGEDPEAAARREVAEELGIEVGLDRGGVLAGNWNYKHESLAWFVADWPGGRGRYDPVEIAEVRWFSPDALPPHIGQAARAVLAHVAPGHRARRGPLGG